VIRISDDPRRFEPGSKLQHEDGRTLVVSSSRTHGARFLVGFEGIDRREGAEGLRGAVYGLDADRRSLGDDEFWQTDLVGCSVVLADGSDVGHVTGIVESAAQDILVLDTPRGERMIPLVKELVPTVDVAARRIVVDPPQGLLD